MNISLTNNVDYGSYVRIELHSFTFKIIFTAFSVTSVSASAFQS